MVAYRMLLPTPARHLPGALRVLRLALLLALVLCATAAAQAAAQTVQGGRLVLSAQTVWDYAEALFRGREYYRAVSEYKRLLHFFPESAHAAAARVRIGEAYLHGGEPAQAIDHFSALLAARELEPLRPALRYLRGLGRLELDGAAPYTLRERHIAAALADLRTLPAGWPAAPGAPEFVRAMERMEDADVPSKWPWLAGSLSALLPGLGSVYGGNLREGALAFFVNALFIGGAYQAFRHDDDAVGIVLGVGALAFYGGAIYAAANGAHQYNDRARGSYLGEQRTRYGIVLQPEGLAGLLERKF